MFYVPLRIQLRNPVFISKRGSAQDNIVGVHIDTGVRLNQKYVVLNRGDLRLRSDRNIGNHYQYSFASRLVL